MENNLQRVAMTEENPKWGNAIQRQEGLYARKNDLWFHTKDIHGSHAILILNNVNSSPSDEVLTKCAEIAAFHSKARLSSNVPVDFFYVRFVKKPNGAKPGMVIYTNNSTLYVTPKIIKY